MTEPLIGPRTLRVFREHIRTWTYREIVEEFELAGITEVDESVPEEQSQRRTLIEQYYAALDTGKISDVQRLISVFEGALGIAESNRISFC